MRKTAVLLLSLTLLGCATGYKPQGQLGGYSETQLAENRFQVLYKGNNYVSRDTANDYLLLRSAEVTLEHGFTHFVMASAQSEEDVQVYNTPVTTSTRGSVKKEGDGVKMKSETVTMGGGVSVSRRPISRAMIICYNGRPPASAKADETRIFDAKLVSTSLRRKYEIKD